MRPFKGICTILALLVLSWSTAANAGDSSPKRFEKGYSEFGFQIGYGAGLNIPSGPDRTDVQFVFFAPNFKYDLTGNIGQSFYQGNLYLMSEITLLALHHPDSGYLVGGSPILQYKFVDPKRSWAPTILGGIGFANTDIDKKSIADREISGNFQFLIHFGVGIEFFKIDEEKSISINYRFLHISNGGIEKPNIGLNTNMFSLGFSF